MKKILIALFAFVAFFALMGTAQAYDYDDLDIDVDGSDTYACTLTVNVMDCWKDTGTVTKWNDIATSAITSEIVGIKKVGSDLHVYYNQFSIASGDVNLHKLILNTTTGAVISDVTYLSDYGGMATISKDIPQSATNPAIAWLDKTTGAVKIDIDGVVDTTGSLGGTPESAGVFIDSLASTSSQVVAVSYKDVSTGDYAVNNYNTSTNTDDIDIIDSTYLPAYQDLVLFDSTYGKAVIAYQETADKDIYVAYYDGLGYVNTAVVSKTANAVDFEANIEGTNVAIAYTDSDDFRLVVTDENASIVRADTSIDNSYTSYDQVALDDGTNGSVAMVERFNATTESLDEFAYNGATYDISNFEEQGDGAVPELPANNLWKVLIAVLSLGLVVGIAAFMKKKKK